MKKIIALLLTLALSLTAFAAVAEEAEIPEVTVEAAYEGTAVAIGETGVTITLPNDWTVVEAPEGYYAAYNNPDNTMTLSIQPAQGVNACWEAASAMVEQGTAKDLQEVYLNGIYYMLYTTADDLFNFAYLPLTDDSCLAFCFGLTSKDVEGSVALQILGTVVAPE